MTIVFSVWARDYTIKQRELLHNHPEDVDRIVISAEQEYVFPAINSKFQDDPKNIAFANEAVTFSKQYDIPIYCILGTVSEENYDIFGKTLTVDDIEYFRNNVKFIHWDTYWISATCKYLMDYIEFIRPSILYHHSKPDNQYKYPFISLNHRIRSHRLIMMDMLAKHNLIDKGAISWKYIPESADLKKIQLQYWTPSVEELSDIILHDGNFNQFLPPEEYFQSFVQLVSETLTNQLFITEKTVIPALLMKPFIVISCKGFHKHLQEMGFQLYTELFDYSFDDIDDEKLRIEAVITQIKRISTMSIEEMQSMYNRLLPKLRANVHNVIDTAFDIKYFPGPLYLLYQQDQLPRDASLCSDQFDFLLNRNNRIICKSLFLDESGEE